MISYSMSLISEWQPFDSFFFFLPCVRNRKKFSYHNCILSSSLGWAQSKGTRIISAPFSPRKLKTSLFRQKQHFWLTGFSSAQQGCGFAFKVWVMEPCYETQSNNFPRTHSPMYVSLNVCLEKS